jgi:hypothetical protein
MTRFFALLAAVLLLPAILPATAGNAFAQAAYVHEMSGSVTATLDSSTRALKTGDLIAPGTTVATGDKSRAVIKFEDGQLMALAERSSFRIVEYRYVKERVRDSNAVFAVLQGALRFVTGVIGSTNRNALRLSAGTSTIGIRGTDVTVFYDPATQTLTASVTVGEISITRTQGVDILGPGQVFGDLSPALQQTLDLLITQGLPVNLPVSLSASAAAAAAAAEAARLGTPEAIAEAQRLLGIAITAAVEAYEQALRGGGVPPEGASAPGTGGTGGAGGSIGAGSGGSVSPN